MEQEQLILLEKEAEVGWIYLNRPKALNGLNLELAAAFLAALADCNQDPAIRVIVLGGKGKAFCAGGDLKALKALTAQDQATDFVTKVGAMVEAISESPKPVIALVNGVAAGAGFNLALACDLIFAAETASFVQSFTNVGLIPDCGGHYYLTKALGKYWAKEVMFSACPITALEALEYGFVNKVCSNNDLLLKETKAYARALSKRPPLAISACKTLINQSEELSLKEVLVEEARIQGLLMMSTDCKEGLTAFFEKREPEFIGK